MTDKELRKLSRLELLELLLEVSNENRSLNKIIEDLKTENTTSENIRNLSDATLRIENALKYAESLTNSLKGTTDEVGSPTVQHTNTDKYVAKKTEGPLKSEIPSDKDIYLRILCFFAKNEDKLSVFPSDIEDDVRNRILSILKKRTAN